MKRILVIILIIILALSISFAIAKSEFKIKDDFKKIKKIKTNDCIKDKELDKIKDKDNKCKDKELNVGDNDLFS